MRVDDDLCHADLCRLSIAFNAVSDLRTEQDLRINEWLKAQIGEAQALQDALERSVCPDCGHGWTFDFATKHVSCKCSETHRLDKEP